MSLQPPRRLKTLVGAASFVTAPGDPSPTTGAKRAVALARRAEAEKITGLFTADVLQVDPTGVTGTTGSQDPLIALAALSQTTERIGLVATVSTSFEEPYNLARRLATLDHASGGRAAWNLVTSSTGEENFGGLLPDPVERYARASEFVEVVHGLFDASDPEAVRRAPGGAIGIDQKRLRRIDHRGAHFSVQGPLNTPAPLQGRPVQFQAGQSAEGVTLGARFAEVVYTSQPQLAGAVAFAAELRRQARGFGRAEGLPFIMNSLHSLLGETEADVARRLREKHERFDFTQGRVKLADMLGVEVERLADLPLDQPLKAHALPQVEGAPRRRGRIELFRRLALQGLTLRELILAANETGHWHVVGTPERVAEAVEERFRLGILNVVSLHGLGNPDQEDLLLNGLLPELRRRKLLDEDYVEGGFRANLGLPPLPAIRALEEA